MPLPDLGWLDVVLRWVVALLSLGVALWVGKRGAMRNAELTDRGQMMQSLQFDLTTCHRERTELRERAENLDRVVERLEQDLQRAHEHITRLVMRGGWQGD